MGAKDGRIQELEDHIALLTYERDGAEASMEVCERKHEETTPREITQHQLCQDQVVSFHDTKTHKVMGGKLTEILRNEAGEIKMMMLNEGREGLIFYGWSWDTTRITVHQDPARPVFVADLEAAPVGSELRRPNGWQYATKLDRGGASQRFPWLAGKGHHDSRSLLERWPDAFLVSPEEAAKES